MRLSTPTILVCFGALMLAATIICVAGYRISAAFNRRLVRCLPTACLCVQSDVFRFRTGVSWEYGTFQITAKQVLGHWHGIFFGRSPRCRLQAYRARTPAEADASAVSRRHARLDFDEAKQMFFIEDAGSRNQTRWVPLGQTQSSVPRVLTGRLYLRQDIQLWLGDVPLNLRILHSDLASINLPKNPVGAGAVILLQILGLVVCLNSAGGFSAILCLPALLLTVAALRTLLYDWGSTPLPGALFAALTYAWIVYVSCSEVPVDAARLFSCVLFCIGSAAISLPKDVWNCRLNPYSLLTVAGAFLTTFALYHFEILSSFDDALFMLILILVRQTKFREILLKNFL